MKTPPLASGPARVAAIALLSLLAACASKTTVRTEGRIVNDRYVHPGGLFSVDVPALFREGSVIEDEYRGTVGSVTFRDDYGQLIRVDVLAAGTDAQHAYFAAMDATGDWRAPLDGTRDAVIGTMAAAGVDATLVSETFVELEQGEDVVQGKHYTLLLPGGSSMVSVRGLSRERLDAYRFFLALRRGDALYTLSSQHTIGLFGDASREAPINDIQANHRAELEELAAGMTFGGVR